jgi:hypothetical protein
MMRRLRGSRFPWTTILAVALVCAPACIAPARSADGELEQALREGRVVEIESIGTGITKPQRVTLEWQGRTLRAAFKTVDIQESRLTRFKSGGKLHFTDRYAYERAAYLLDRELGLHMVPVTVLRKIDGKRGALIAWVEDALDEGARREHELDDDQTRAVLCQQDLMRVFDALIANDDRNLGNQLYRTDGWQLYLIDHSRAFRMARRLPESYRSQPSNLPRWLLERLEQLDDDRARELFDGVLSRARIRSLLARRDRIVDKAREDIERYGAGIVFHDATCPPLTSEPRGQAGPSAAR